MPIECHIDVTLVGSNQTNRKVIIMNLRRSSIRFASIAVLVTAAFGVQSAMTAPPSAPSSVVTIDPARILDTRTPLGVPIAKPVGPNETITVQVAGVGGVPLNATGVILTLTATDATVPTFITATPTGTPRSTTSVLNPGVTAAIANTITMSLGTQGRIDLYNPAGSVHLVADVTGYLIPGGSTGPVVVTQSIELTAYNATGINLGAPGQFGCVDLGDTGELYLDVPLPHGAAVKKVDFRWFDNDTTNFTMLITETNGAPFAVPTGGNLVDSQTQTTGSVGYGVSSVTVGGGDAVSGSVRYHIVVFTLGQTLLNTVHSFCGATVTYDRLIG